MQLPSFPVPCQAGAVSPEHGAGGGRLYQAALGASTGSVVSNQHGHHCCLLGKCHMCPAHPVDSSVPSSHPDLGHRLHLHYEDTFSGKIVTEEAIG